VKTVKRIKYKRKWCAINRQFCKNGEVIRWGAVGHRTRQVQAGSHKRSQGQNVFKITTCQVNTVIANLSFKKTEDREIDR